jgi:hypothetical protein
MTPDLHAGDPRLQTFAETGALRLDAAFPPEQAQAACVVAWRALGVDPDDPATWTAPVMRLPYLADPEVVACATTPRLHAAFDALVGAGRWEPLRAVGGLVARFPVAGEPGDTGWHVDMSFGDSPDFMEWRVNGASRGRALLLLMLLTDVSEEDAPTRLRLGSHRIIAERLAPHGEAGLSLRELAADGFRETEACPEALATGPAGTVWLCHPFLVHAAQPHRGTRPRLLAQPGLPPRGRA